jgi:hypothetical protein
MDAHDLNQERWTVIPPWEIANYMSCTARDNEIEMMMYVGDTVKLCDLSLSPSL